MPHQVSRIMVHVGSGPSAFVSSLGSLSHVMSDVVMPSLFQFLVVASSIVNYSKDAKVEDGVVDNLLPCLWTSPLLHPPLPSTMRSMFVLLTRTRCCPNTPPPRVQDRTCALHGLTPCDVPVFANVPTIPIIHVSVLIEPIMLAWVAGSIHIDVPKAKMLTFVMFEFSLLVCIYYIAY